MDLEARKIEFIQEFLKLENEEVILNLERILQTEFGCSKKQITEPMSIQEFNVRFAKSMQDSKNGKLTETNDLLVEIEKWS